MDTMDTRDTTDTMDPMDTSDTTDTMNAAQCAAELAERAKEVLEIVRVVRAQLALGVEVEQHAGARGGGARTEELGGVDGQRRAQLAQHRGDAAVGVEAKARL